MKRVFVFIVICFLLLFERTESVPTSFFEGFDTLLTSEYDFLNPVYGQLLAFKQDVIENFYVSGNKNHPLTKLCKQLFFKREEDGKFGPTKKSEYISTYLTPYDFGWIVALVLFKTDVFKDASLYSECEKSEKADKDVCLFLKKIKEAQQKKGVKTPFKPSAVFKFINLIIEARKQAEAQFYDASIPIHILLALACMKATEKVDILDIMRGIYDHIPTDKAVFKEEQKILFKVENKEEEKLFLEKIYEEEKAITDFKNLVRNPKLKAFSLHTFLLQLLMVSSFENVQMLTIKGSSDCTESGLVEFTRFLLDNEGVLDTKLLPEKLQQYPFVLEFVKRFNGKSVNDEVARTWFFNALSGKQTLEYVGNQNYEIRANLKNILQGLNLIFGTNATELKALGSQLSTDDRMVQFEIKEVSDSKYGGIVLTITNQDVTRTDELKVREGHTEVVRSVDTELVSKGEALIRTFFGNEAIDSYPLCIFKETGVCLNTLWNNKLETAEKKQQIDDLLTHALKTTGFGLFCALLNNSHMQSLVKEFFNQDLVIPATANAGSGYMQLIIERYRNDSEQKPFSTYVVRFPVEILKKELLGSQYQQNVLKLFKFLQTKKALEDNTDALITLLMSQYENREDEERFKYGAFEKLLMQIAEEFPEIFSATVHKMLWDRENLANIDSYLFFEVFLVGKQADFFSKSKIETMHEFVLKKELKELFSGVEVASVIQAYGATVLKKNKALFPTMEQNSLPENLQNIFNKFVADNIIKKQLTGNYEVMFNVMTERRALLIFSILSIERLVRQKNSKFKKELHMLNYLKESIFTFRKRLFLNGLIEFNKEYPNELWSTMVNENQTFAELLVTEFTANQLEEFVNRGFNIPIEILNAQKATPEERKKLLARYRPSSEMFTDFAYVLAFI